jgi:hypothetical protein
MVAATAWLVALRLGLPTAAGRLLSAYVVGFAEIVVITLGLSALDTFRAPTLLGAVALMFACALAAIVLGRPAPPPGSEGRHVIRDAIRDPILVVLGLVVAAGLVYSAALLLFTPANDWDAMTYHLARAAFWIQQHAVGYVPAGGDLRIDVNPPNAEIGSAFTMILSESDRIVGIVEFAAALATALGVYGIASRIGLPRNEALFGALAFLSLPVIMLQSSSTLNDLVVASFLVASTYFLLGTLRVELVLGGVSVAMAVGTKYTAYIALPLLALIVLAGQPRRRWPGVALAGIAGMFVGSYWLIVNLVETGQLDGGAGDLLDQHPDRSPAPVLARTTRMLVNLADDLNLGTDLLLYPIAAALAGLAVFACSRRKRRAGDPDGSARGRAAWIAKASLVGVACVPLLLGTIHEYLLRAHEKLWLSLGETDLAFIDRERESPSPSTSLSHFGPLGFVLVLAGMVAATVAWRRGDLRRLAVLLAAAPAVMVFLVALALVYDPWRGRFLVFGLALAASTWGLVLRYRWLAWGATSIAAVTVLLTFVHSLEKPAGVRIFDEETSRGVWGEPREVVQTWRRSDGTAEVVDFFGREPQSGRVGLRVSGDDWVYPYFGRSLARDVAFVPDGQIDRTLDWLVVAPSREGKPGRAWSLALQTTDGWRVYRQAHTGDVSP